MIGSTPAAKEALDGMSGGTARTVGAIGVVCYRSDKTLVGI
jgi:hypothetical protein